MLNILRFEFLVAMRVSTELFRTWYFWDECQGFG